MCLPLYSTKADILTLYKPDRLIVAKKNRLIERHVYASKKVFLEKWQEILVRSEYKLLVGIAAIVLTYYAKKPQITKLGLLRF